MEQTNNILQTGEPISPTATSTAPISSTPQTPPIAPIQPAAPANESWRTILSILLIIFFGPIGIIVMWIVARWPKWVKYLITAVVIIPILIMIALGLVGLRAFKGAVNTANDSKTIADIKMAQSALEIYQTENGRYPACPQSKDVCDLSDLKLSSLIITPSSNYVYSLDQDNYLIRFTLTNGKNCSVTNKIVEAECFKGQEFK